MSLYLNELKSMERMLLSEDDFKLFNLNDEHSIGCILDLVKETQRAFCRCPLEIDTSDVVVGAPAEVLADFVSRFYTKVEILTAKRS